MRGYIGVEKQAIGNEGKYGSARARDGTGAFTCLGSEPWRKWWDDNPLAGLKEVVKDVFKAIISYDNYIQ